MATGQSISSFCKTSDPECAFKSVCTYKNTYAHILRRRKDTVRITFRLLWRNVLQIQSFISCNILLTSEAQNVDLRSSSLKAGDEVGEIIHLPAATFSISALSGFGV